MQLQDVFGLVNIPGGPINCPYIFADDFDQGGSTIIDLELANESGFYARYFSPLKLDATGGTEGDETGVWLVSYDSITAVTQLPATQTGTGGDCGVIKMTTDATSGERISMQLTSTPINFKTGRRALFHARLKFTNTTQDAFFGLAVTAATDPHASRPAGFVAFTLTASSTLQFASGNASTATASASLAGTITADTYFNAAIYWDGKDTALFFKDGVMIGSTTTTLPTGLGLSPVMCVESNGAAEAMFIDYVICAVDRP